MASADAEQLMVQVDQLYGEQKYKEALDLLEPQVGESQDVELLWRVMRLYFRLGKASPDKSQADALAEKAYHLSERGLKINENVFGIQKWSGIILNWYSDVAGLKFKVDKSAQIRKHFERAIELDPKEPFVKYLLGRWCYKVTSLPWYQRKAAGLLGTLPTSTYEEAISYFEAAEAVNPRPFPPNWLFMAKCYVDQKKWAEAKKWLTKILEFDSNPKDPDLKEALEEAKVLIKKV